MLVQLHYPSDFIPENHQGREMLTWKHHVWHLSKVANARDTKAQRYCRWTIRRIHQHRASLHSQIGKKIPPISISISRRCQRPRIKQKTLAAALLARQHHILRPPIHKHRHVRNRLPRSARTYIRLSSGPSEQRARINEWPCAIMRCCIVGVKGDTDEIVLLLCE